MRVQDLGSVVVQAVPADAPLVKWHAVPSGRLNAHMTALLAVPGIARRNAHAGAPALAASTVQLNAHCLAALLGAPGIVYTRVAGGRSCLLLESCTCRDIEGHWAVVRLLPGSAVVA